MQKNRPSEIIWRLTKVLYFVVTTPLILGICVLLLTDTFADKSNSLILIHDRYLWAIYGILVIFSYLLITDLFRRIVSYIGGGKWYWFIPYIELLNGKRIMIQKSLIALGVIIILLFIWSYNVREYCTWENEYIDKGWVCACDDWYIKSEGACIITFEQKIRNVLPSGAFLREYVLIPWTDDVYMGIYIENYRIESPLDEQTILYQDCYSMVMGQAITWDYYVFTYSKWKIVKQEYITPSTSILNKLSIAYINTKEMNYQYYKGIQPKPEDKNRTEITRLLNFRDLNGDGVSNEFQLIDHADQVCGHNNYNVIWYDKTNSSPVIYWIQGFDYKIDVWWDNFVPNEKWEVTTWWECWDHGSGTEIILKYIFNKKDNYYSLIKNETKECAPWTY